MGLPKRLTEMQMKFAHLLVSNEGRMNGYECAKEAGYSEDRARVTASELQSPKKYAVTFERHITELGKIRAEALKKGAWSAAVNAEVARGKAAGLYIEQKIIRTGKLDDLSEIELENRMKEIMDEYSPILEGTSTEELKEKVKGKQKQIRLKKVSPTSSSSEPKKSESLSDPQK